MITFQVKKVILIVKLLSWLIGFMAKHVEFENRWFLERTGNQV